MKSWGIFSSAGKVWRKKTGFAALSLGSIKDDESCPIPLFHDGGPAGYGFPGYDTGGVSLLSAVRISGGQCRLGKTQSATTAGYSWGPRMGVGDFHAQRCGDFQTAVALI
jgi:acetyl-CoA acetyltransferase